MLRRHPSIGAMPFAPVAGALVLPAVRYAATELRNAEAIARMFARKPALRLAMLAVMPVLWVAAFASLVWLIGDRARQSAAGRPHRDDGASADRNARQRRRRA